MEEEAKTATSIAHISRTIYLKPLRIKIITIAVTALFFSTNILSNAFFESNITELDFDEEILVESQPTYIPTDGFLTKPSSQTSDGIRLGVNEVVKYTVKSGDSISYIAARFNVSAATILAANNLQEGSFIKVGQELNILPVDGVFYTVKENDTLDKIAQTFKVDKQKIMEQNKLKDEKLVAKNNLILPGATPQVPEPPKQNPTLYANTKISTPKTGTTAKGQANSNFKPIISNSFAWPVAGKGRLTQSFSYRHPALDITYPANNMHPAILAADDGVVVEAKTSGWNSGYGNVIVIDHGNGVKTRYAHNSSVFVSAGQKVYKGQHISNMGNTGRVYGKTGIHVHFEVIINGTRVNPMTYY